MKTAFDFSSNTSTTGAIYHPKFPTSGYIIHIVDIVEQYRADKIAYDYYGNADLHWVLDAANNFYNGFSEYQAGVEIKVPTVATLLQMGIISSDEA